MEYETSKYKVVINNAIHSIKNSDGSITYTCQRLSGSLTGKLTLRSENKYYLRVISSDGICIGKNYYCVLYLLLLFIQQF